MPKTKRWELVFRTETTHYVYFDAETEGEAEKEWDRIKNGGDFIGTCRESDPQLAHLWEDGRP